MLQYVRQVMRARNEDGASAVEYGLLVAAIAAVVVVIAVSLGGIIRDAFKTTCDEIQPNVTTTEECDTTSG